MGEKKVVLDTNILISALGWGGKPKEIFRLFLKSLFKLIISKKQIEELIEVMNYSKFNFQKEEKIEFIILIMKNATIVETDDDIKVISEDPDDDVILESASENGADFIVSGDEHILKLKEFNGVKIVTAAEFLKQIDLA